ncbi:hypothetical protein GC194_02735 [bacterium]|nr:hypothetical protein [bacterium]
MYQQQFKTTKTVNVFTNTNSYNEVAYVWVALHGYGQLARYFSRNFEILNPEKHLVIIPEAQSRFYLNGVGLHDKRVGATWMTREERETDIADYVQYLNDLKSRFADQLPTDVKWVVLGFSQGAATACRWVELGNIAPAALVLWSSIFPPDLPVDGRLKDKCPEIYLLMGDEDEYMNDARWAENQQIAEKLGISPHLIEFKGKHRIYPEVLGQLAKKIEAL